MNYTTRETCRVCGSKDLTFLFSIGEQYVNAFPENREHDDFPKAPLDLELCNNCTLVQLKHTAPQELLYSGHYWYRSGTTQTMRDALKDIADDATELVGLKAGDVVLDIGSNDGTLLRCYPKDLVTVGIEPAKNLSEEGAKDIDIFINTFWEYPIYSRLLREFRGKGGLLEKAK